MLVIITIIVKSFELCEDKKISTTAGILIGITGTLLLTLLFFLTGERFTGHGGFNAWLLERLVSTKPLPDDFNKSHRYSRKIIYVLGGAQNSLNYRFKTAAGLYQSYMADRILILSRPGITEYDPSRGRNITNNEWSVKRLEELGVQKQDIEKLPLKSGFFGTLREAQHVARLVIQRDYDVLILVSSSYHTARVSDCFAKYLTDKEVNVYIYGSIECPSLWGLLLEYFKLNLYKHILL